jgi:hypothetical protein
MFHYLDVFLFVCASSSFLDDTGIVDVKARFEVMLD